MKVTCWEPWDLIAQFTENLNESGFTQDVFIRREERELVSKGNFLACVRAGECTGVCVHAHAHTETIGSR